MAIGGHELGKVKGGLGCSLMAAARVRKSFRES